MKETDAGSLSSIADPCFNSAEGDNILIKPVKAMKKNNLLPKQKSRVKPDSHLVVIASQGKDVEIDFKLSRIVKH